MKFRFCGDGDCPDWVLAEIHSTLSVLSSVKLRILTQMVAKSILGEDIPEEKLREIITTSKSDLSSSKSAFSCLRFLLISAVRHNTDTNTFGAELQQLGLPKEHSTAICRTMSEYSNDLQRYLVNRSLTVNEVSEMSYTIPTDAIDCTQLNITIKNEIIDNISKNQTHKINIQKSDIPILLNELKTIKNLMDNLDYEKKYNEE